MMAKVKIRAALACEDIRTEITGKSIYIGVYGPSLYVPELPCSFNFSFILIMDFLETGYFELDAQIIDDTKNVFVKGKLRGDIKQQESGAPMNFPGIPITIRNSTTLRLQVRNAPDATWEMIQSWTIECIPDTQPKPRETPQL